MAVTPGPVLVVVLPSPRTTRQGGECELMHGGPKMLVASPTHMHPFQFSALVQHGTSARQRLSRLRQLKPVPVGTEPGQETSAQRYGDAGHAHPEVSIRVRQKKLFEVFAQRTLLRLQGLQLGDQRADGPHLGPALPQRRLQGPLLHRAPDARCLLGGPWVPMLPQPGHQIAQRDFARLDRVGPCGQKSQRHRAADVGERGQDLRIIALQCGRQLVGQPRRLDLCQ